MVPRQREDRLEGLGSRVRRESNSAENERNVFRSLPACGELGRILLSLSRNPPYWFPVPIITLNFWSFRFFKYTEIRLTGLMEMESCPVCLSLPRTICCIWCICSLIPRGSVVERRLTWRSICCVGDYRMTSHRSEYWHHLQTHTAAAASAWSQVSPTTQRKSFVLFYLCCSESQTSGAYGLLTALKFRWLQPWRSKTPFRNLMNPN